MLKPVSPVTTANAFSSVVSAITVTEVVPFGTVTVEPLATSSPFTANTAKDVSLF